MQDPRANLKRALIRHMGKYEPYENIIFDGQPHEYEAYVDGKNKRSVYTATLYPFDSMRNGPALMCHYGPIDEKEQYTYPSPKSPE